MKGLGWHLCSIFCKDSGERTDFLYPWIGLSNEPEGLYWHSYESEFVWFNISWLSKWQWNYALHVHCYHVTKQIFLWVWVSGLETVFFIWKSLLVLQKACKNSKIQLAKIFKDKIPLYISAVWAFSIYLKVVYFNNMKILVDCFKVILIKFEKWRKSFTEAMKRLDLWV